MAQPFNQPGGGELPFPLPLLLPLPQPPKRRREESDSEADRQPSAPPKRQAQAQPQPQPQDVIFRILVPSRQIGKVIGKLGSRIQKIREDTRATIKIADPIARHEERVIIISSKENDDGAVTYAETALQKIAALILREDAAGDDDAKCDSNSSNAHGLLEEASSNVGATATATATSGAATASSTAVHVGANTIRLLIAGSQAGSLIGMSGQNIARLRESSGANISILAPSQLPLCASACESDRVVQLCGDVPAVLKALQEIASHLRVNPPRQVISISPAYNYGMIRPPQPFLPPTSGQPILQLIM